MQDNEHNQRQRYRQRHPRCDERYIYDLEPLQIRQPYHYGLDRVALKDQ